MPTQVNHEELPTKGEMEAVVNEEFDGLSGAIDEHDTSGATEGDDNLVRVEGEDRRGRQEGTGDERLDDDDAGALEPDRPRTQQRDQNDGRPRDEQGRFAKAEGDGNVPRGTSGAPAPGAAPASGAAPAGPAAGGAANVEWQPLQVTVDRAIFPIQNAAVGSLAGHKVVSIPDQHWPAFQSQLTKGVVAERRWRELQDLRTQFDTERKQAELEKQAPTPKSEAEIEAEVILEWLRPKMGELFDDERERTWLADRVRRAQLEHRDEHAKTRSDWFEEQKRAEAARPNPEAEERERVNGLGDVMKQIADARPQEFGAVTPELARLMADDVMQVRRAAYYKDRDEQGQMGWYADTQLIYDRMKAALARATAGRQPVTPTPGATPGTTGTGQGTGTNAGTGADERFNRGQRGGRPVSTNLRNNRGADPRVPAGTTGNRPSEGGAPRTRHEKAMAADDAWRQAGRNYMKSPTLDFEDDPPAEG